MSALDDLLAEREAELQKLRVDLQAMADSVQTDAEFFRREFIREAAMRIYTQRMNDSHEVLTAEGVRTIAMYTPVTCWIAAKALWDAKPEDC